MGQEARKGRNKMFGDNSYDRWMLAAADESAAERYLPDGYEPETILFTIWWESESADIEDSFDIEVENRPDRREWAMAVAKEEIEDRDDIPDDAVVTEMWEDWY